MNIKSHFTFNKQQRSGILFLLFFIVILLCVYHFFNFNNEKFLDTSSPKIVALQTQIDSLRFNEIEARKPKLYPFNPNYITDYKAYTLGISPEEFDRLKTYRNNDKWINSKNDFKNVTQISDSLLAVISPYFKFPEWITNPKAKNNFKDYKSEKGYSEKSFAQKIDLNKATEEQLQQVSGIGNALSKRIIEYRKKLDGFTNDIQLYNVYGLESFVVKRALNEFTVKTPKEIVKLDINSASASDLATIPGIPFDLAKKIWEYRILRERINSFSELDKIEGLTVSKFQLIQLYLSIKE